MKQFSWLIRFGPALIVMALIFLASSIPSAQMPNAGGFDLFVKKGGHMTGYALLAWMLIRAQDKSDLKSILFALLGCAIYALSDEFHQSFVAGRNSTLVDVCIDLAGASIGLLLIARSIALRRLILMKA
jgi:VanZ family protein